MERVQIPAYSDAWMQGDRYGSVVGYSFEKPGSPVQVALVKLDKSQRKLWFVGKDLQEVK